LPRIFFQILILMMSYFIWMEVSCRIQRIHYSQLYLVYMFIGNKILYYFIYFFCSACLLPYPRSMMVTAAYASVPTMRIWKKNGVHVQLGVVDPLDPARHFHSRVCCCYHHTEWVWKQSRRAKEIDEIIKNFISNKHVNQ
jgi:hypothetical protein